MSKKECNNTGFKKGVLVNVQTCECSDCSDCHSYRPGSKPDCVQKIEPIIDVKHCVIIRNLKLYPMNLNCISYINGSGDKVCFKSTKPGDTDKIWTISQHSTSGACTIEYVQLIAKRQGKENISSEVTAIFPHDGEDADFKFEIEVEGL